MPLFARLFAPIAGLLLMASSGTTPALAQDAAVAFEGTHEAGGLIRFTLGAGGNDVIDLEIEGLAGGGCSWDPIHLDNWGGPIPFRDGAFEATNADGDSISGQFVDASRAEGTVQMSDPGKGCQTPPLRWVASLP
jgi:hypothetical protein